MSTALTWPTDYLESYDSGVVPSEHADAALNGSLGWRVVSTGSNKAGASAVNLGDFASATDDVIMRCAMGPKSGDEAYMGVRLFARLPLSGGVPQLTGSCYMVQIYNNQVDLLKGAFNSSTPTNLGSFDPTTLGTVSGFAHYQIQWKVRTVGSMVVHYVWQSTSASPGLAVDADWNLKLVGEDTSSPILTANWHGRGVRAVSGTRTGYFDDFEIARALS